MIINFTNFSKRQLKSFSPLINEILKNLIDKLKISSNLEISFSLVSKNRIKKVNNLTRKVNKVTDVLSFPTLPLLPKDCNNLSNLVTPENFRSDINPENEHIYLGDILLCLPQVKKQAKLFGNTLNREVGYMSVHGFLHLLGFDHLSEDDKKNMRVIEEAVLQTVGLNRN